MVGREGGGYSQRHMDNLEGSEDVDSNFNLEIRLSVVTNSAFKMSGIILSYMGSSFLEVCT